MGNLRQNGVGRPVRRGRLLPRRVQDALPASNAVRAQALPAGLVLLVLLAGCSGHAPAAAPARDPVTGSPLGNATANLTAPAGATTETLYLTPLARMNTTGLANLTILATLAGSMPQAFAWNATLNGTGNLTEARVVLWLDLQSTAAQPGVGGDAACTAQLTLWLTLNKTQTGQAGGCASAGVGYVPPGEHRIELSTPLTAFPKGARVQPGDGVLVQVAFGLSLPQGVGYLLGGPDHDSHLRLRGLREPGAPPPL